MARVNKQKIEPKKEVLERALLRLDEDIILFRRQLEGIERQLSLPVSDN